MGIRTAQPADLDIIADIYNGEVLGSVATMDTIPRSPAEFLVWLEDHPPESYPVLVADDGAGSVLGWASLTSFSPRLGYRRCAEVSVYVHRDHRATGIGASLLGELVRIAPTVGIFHLVARIESSGEASLRLHARHGFERVGTLHEVAEKFGRVLDVVLMERRLGNASQRPA